MESPLETTDDLFQSPLQATVREGLFIQNTGDEEEVWKVGATIGRGSFGSVSIQTRDTAGKTLFRAVKTVTVLSPAGGSSIHEKAIRRELKALIALRKYTDMFVTFFGWYQNPAKDSIFIAMEYLTGGDLYRYMKENQLRAKGQCREIVTQILQALEKMHEEGYCHRDLKPANVLIASVSPNLRVKLADFGITKSTNPSASLMSTYNSGTVKYMAPEVQGYNDEHTRANKGYTNAVDIWSLGVLTHELFTGIAPFCIAPQQSSTGSALLGQTDVSLSYTASTSLDAPLSPLMLWKFSESPQDFPEAQLHTASAPDDLIRFIKQTMQYRPEKRLTASKALKHPWLDPTQIGSDCHQPHFGHEQRLSLTQVEISSYKYSAVFNRNTVSHTINGLTEIWRKDYRIGGGGLTEVWRECRDVHNKQIFRAVKSKRFPGGYDRESIITELKIRIAIREYSNLFVDFYGWYEGDQNTVFIAMDYLPEGDLYTYRQRDKVRAKNNCREISTQVLEALKILHQNNICHRNLKPKNLLVASSSPLRLKLSGFGLARSTNPDASRMKTKVGSRRYMAPEMQDLDLGIRKGEYYTEAVDMWALGALTYEILTGYPPFWVVVNYDIDDDYAYDNGSDDDDFCRDKSNAVLERYCRESASKFPSDFLEAAASPPRTLIDFLFWLLRPNPEERLPASVALEHPWIKGVDFDDDPSWTRMPFIPKNRHRFIDINNRMPGKD